MQVLAMVAVALASPARGNDLVRIYGIALENDPTFQAAKYARDAAVEAAPQARALLLPQVAATYSEVFNDSHLSVSYTDPVTGRVVPFSVKDHGTDRDAALNVQQALFNLESWYKLKQAGDEVVVAQMNYRSSEQDLMLRVASAYFGVLRAREGMTTATSKKESLGQQLNRAQGNVAVGLSTVTDQQDVQARYDLSVSEELEARQELTEANATLDELTKLPPAAPDDGQTRVVPLIGPPVPEKVLAGLREEASLPRMTPETEQYWAGLAEFGNLDVMAARYNMVVAAQGVKAIRARHLPTLSLNAGYMDSRTTGALPVRSNGPQVSLNLNVPIFSGGAVSSAVRQAVATREERHQEMEATLRQAERDLRVAFERVMTDDARIKALKVAAASSAVALDAAQTGLRIGTRTMIDVLDAQQQRFAAERDSERSRYDYLLALLHLKALGGMLTLHDLEDVDSLLVGK